MKKNMIKLGLAIAMVLSLGVTTAVKANDLSYPITNNVVNYPSGNLVSKDYVIAHEAGNPRNVGIDSLNREISYMKNNWQSAFVSHFVGSGGKIVQLAPVNKVQWGAGSYANQRAYAQVELSRTNSKATFDKDYKAYIWLLAKLNNDAGLPKQVDAGRGIVSHNYISKNFWGNHTNPYGYLKSFGVTEAKFKKDLVQAMNGKQSIPNVTKPVKPVDKPTTSEGGFSVGQEVRVSNKATKYQTGQNIARFVKGSKYKITAIKKVNQSQSKQAGLLGGINSWVLAQDLDIVKVTTQTVKVPKVSGLTHYKENGTFTANTAVAIKNSPTVAAKQKSVLVKGKAVKYTHYVKSNGYIWVYNETQGYVCEMQTLVSHSVDLNSNSNPQI